MTSPFISDFTKRTLIQFGWKDGDPIPDALGELLLAAKERTGASQRQDVMIDIEKMTPGDVERVKQLLAEEKALDVDRKKKAKLEEETKNMDPSVAEFYAKLKEQQEASQNALNAIPSAPLPPEDNNAPQIIDDREETEKAQSHDEIDNTAKPPMQLPVDEDGALPPIVLPFCPRCGWDMRMKFDIEVTDQDKEAFVAILLGNTRFKKTYAFLNDKYNVTFRSLLAEENTMIHRQLVLDNEDKQFATESEWFLRMFEYRLALALDSVYTGDGKPMAVLPEMSEVKHTPPDNKPFETPLVYMREYVNNKVLAHEVTRRLVAQKLRDFQRLVEALEAMALEPSFWEGIG